MGFREFLQSNNKLGELKNEAKLGFRIGTPSIFMTRTPGRAIGALLSALEGLIVAC